MTAIPATETVRPPEPPVTLDAAHAQRLQGLALAAWDRLPEVAVRLLDHVQLVRSLEQLEDGCAHRPLDDRHQLLGVELLGRPDEQRPAAALVMRSDGDELEDPLDLVVSVAGVSEALRGATPHEVLGARARVDPRRLDADDTARPGAVRGRDADQRDHLLRDPLRDRRSPPDRLWPRSPTNES